MRKINFLGGVLAIVLSLNCYAQNNITKNDSTYYDSWVGVWYQEANGKIDKETGFIVKRSLYHSSYEEYWLRSGGIGFSMAWRAWDTRTKSWDFAWMSSDGLFQNWQGKKINGIWYMYKTFIINGKEVLSRQAFIPQGDKVMIRTSEHSSDNGKTWNLRFREKYIKQ